VDLDTCVEEVLVLLRNNPAKGEDVQVKLTQRGSLPSVRVDDEQMRQVFFNLAMNSCEAMTGGGVLEVTTGVREDGTVTVSFRDDGPGIAAEDVARLYEPFFTTKSGGTGLGLAIANKIVNSHGGSIEFRNLKAGGAEFVVVLPIAEGDTTDSKNDKRSAELSAAR